VEVDPSAGEEDDVDLHAVLERLENPFVIGALAFEAARLEGREHAFGVARFDEEIDVARRAGSTEHTGGDAPDQAVADATRFERAMGLLENFEQPILREEFLFWKFSGLAEERSRTHGSAPAGNS